MKNLNLEKISGLPIEMAEDYTLKFKEPLSNVVPALRKFIETKHVTMETVNKPDDEVLYYMYRDIRLPEDEEFIRKHHVRYDITVIPPVKLGMEFNKTVGHYHPLIPGKEVAYPELYEVLHGEGLFLIQKMDRDFKNLINILAIRASTGQKVIYPPNYGHVIVNIGSDVLITANWVSDQFHNSLYEPVSEKHGMAYYVVESQKKQFELVPNPSYTSHPPIRTISTFDPDLGFMINEPMYKTGMRYPNRLEFLNNPEKYAVQLSSVSS
jgi:glucose-6-phosphate isomerase, archaeal